MRLTIPERLKLLELLPPKESYKGMMEIQRLGMNLSVQDAEAIEIEVEHTEDGMIKWNQDKALGLIVDIPMGEWVTNLLRQVLRDRDREGDLEVTELSLFEKFILDYE